MRGRGLHRTRSAISCRVERLVCNGKGVGYADARFICISTSGGKCSTLPPFSKIWEVLTEDPHNTANVLRLPEYR